MIYRKPTPTHVTIHFTSNHPFEQKLAAFVFYINRMFTLPIIVQDKQREWNTVITIARNNGFPLHIVSNLRNELKTKTQQTLTKQTHRQKKWITFTYHSPLIQKITNLLKHTNLNIPFRATNTYTNNSATK